MIKFVEFNNYYSKRRVSIDVFSIVDVSEDEDRTYISLKVPIGSSKEFSPAQITVRESYDDVMYQIRSAINATEI